MERQKDGKTKRWKDKEIKIQRHRAKERKETKAKKSLKTDYCKKLT